MVDGDWDSLRSFVIRDRTAAGFTQQKFADQLRISVKSVNSFEAGRSRMRRSTLSRVETVLGWVTGSVQVVLNGGEPSYAQRRTEADLRDDTERDMWELGRESGHPLDRVWWHIDQRRERLAREGRDGTGRGSSA